MNNFEIFYNEFKDWSKKEILQRTYDITNDYIELQTKINKAIECIKNRNTIKSKKERFMSGKSTLERVLEILGDKENEEK